jgi:hypothetical protein
METTVDCFALKSALTGQELKNRNKCAAVEISLNSPGGVGATGADSITS